MTRVLVLTAVELEARALARDLGLAPVAGAAWPHFRGGALEIAGVGVGAARLDTRAHAASDTDLVISAGTCGALSPELAAGDLVAPEFVLTASGTRVGTAAVRGLTRRGTLLGVAAVVESAESKARLWLETGALAVDMESAAVLAWAAARGLPAAVLRGVSDTADHGVPADLAGVIDDGGRVRTMRAVRAALARPRGIADARRLRAGTTAALRSVAAALARVVAARGGR